MLAVRLHLLRALVVLLIILLIVLLVILLVILLVVLLIVLVVLIVLIVLLLLLLWLLALLRIKLLLTRGKRLADLWLVVAVVIIIVRAVAAGPGLTRLLLLVVGLALAELLLRRGDQPKIMLGVLIIILGGDRVTGTLRVAGKLQIFLADVGCRAANFHVRSIRLVHARQWILMMVMTTTAATPTLTVTTPHALVLTVSHDLLFRQPRLRRR